MFKKGHLKNIFLFLNIAVLVFSFIFLVQAAPVSAQTCDPAGQFCSNGSLMAKCIDSSGRPTTPQLIKKCVSGCQSGQGDIGAQCTEDLAATKQSLKDACTKFGGTINKDGYCEKGGRVINSDELYKTINNATSSGNLSTTTPSGLNLMHELITRLKQLIVLAAFLMFLLSIFYYTTSGGDAKKIGKAKEFLASAITALIALALVQIFIPRIYP